MSTRYRMIPAASMPPRKPALQGGIPWPPLIGGGLGSLPYHGPRPIQSNHAYRTMHHKAQSPSRHPIFLPSA